MARSIFAHAVIYLVSYIPAQFGVMRPSAETATGPLITNPAPLSLQFLIRAGYSSFAVPSCSHVSWAPGDETMRFARVSVRNSIGVNIGGGAKVGALLARYVSNHPANAAPKKGHGRLRRWYESL